MCGSAILRHRRQPRRVLAACHRQVCRAGRLHGEGQELGERTKSRHQIAREVEDLKKKGIEVAETNHSSYRAGDQPVVSATNASIDPRALAMLEDAGAAQAFQIFLRSPYHIKRNFTIL